MPSLVVQLQTEAMDPNINVSDLLRRAKIVAVKLSRDDISEWIENELNGYSSKNYPAYRKAVGTLQYRYQNSIWRSYNFEKLESNFVVPDIFLYASVSVLQSLLQDDSVKQINVTIPVETLTVLAKEANLRNAPIEMRIAMSKSIVAGILDSIRNGILDWSLKLEQAGIKGEGISFSMQEKEVAKGTTTINVGTIAQFSGNLGNVSDQAVVNATQTNTFSEANLNEIRSLLSQMQEHLPAVGLTPEEKDSVENETKIIEDELSSEQPDHSRLRSALSSIGRILQGAAENIIASGIIHQITSLLP